MKDDGGNAFPLPLGTANCAEPSQSGGMSLRDYFAAAALQGLCANANINPDVQYGPMAYKLADDMLRNRCLGDNE